MSDQIFKIWIMYRIMYNFSCYLCVFWISPVGDSEPKTKIVQAANREFIKINKLCKNKNKKKQLHSFIKKSNFCPCVPSAPLKKQHMWCIYYQRKMLILSGTLLSSVIYQQYIQMYYFLIEELRISFMITVHIVCVS